MKIRWFIKIAIFPIIFLAASNVCGIDMEKTLIEMGFVETSLPGYSEQLKAIRTSLNYCVDIADEKIIVLQKQQCENKPIQRIDIGKTKFIGTDIGEFGGELRVEFESGQSKILIKDNVVQMIYDQNVLWVFTGLIHLSLNRGAIYKVTSLKKDPQVKRVTLLPWAPQYVILKKHDVSGSRGLWFMIVTTEAILFYLDGFEILQVHANKLFKNGLYPLSAIFQKNKILVGMPKGVGIIKLGHSESFTYYERNIAE